jgi:peroxiredoxin
MWIELLALAQHSRIAGQVVAADGQPVPGARVIAGEFGRATMYVGDPDDMFVGTPGLPAEQSSRYSAQASSGADGRFEIGGLAAGDYSVMASAARRGIAMTTIRMAESGAASLRLELEPPAFIEGAVAGLDFDATQHVLELRPRVPRVNVLFTPELQREEGRWSFRSVALPAVREWNVVGTQLVTEGAFRATLFSVPVDAEPGEVTKVQVEFGGALTISGVLRGSGGEPIAHAAVLAVSRTTPTREFGAVSDAAGRYLVRGLSNGVWRLEASRYALRDSAGCGNGALEWWGTYTTLLGGESQSLDLALSAAPPAPAVGVLAPSFEALLLNGGTVSLAQLRGKFVLVDFWATWCGMCRMDLPGLQATYERHRASGRFEIVGVSLDENADVVRRFVASRGLAWPQTALGPARSNPIAQRFNVQATPSTYLLDPEGRVVEVGATGDELARRIDALLAAK